MEHKARKGTTTVGIVTNKGVILAADRRASLGNLAMHKVRKINKISNFVGVTEAGYVGDNQFLVKFLRAEMKLFELDNEKEPTVEVASSMLSNILFGGKGYFPYMVALLMGGKSNDGGFKLYSLMGDGSSISDTYTSVGSGMQLALAIVEQGYKKEMSTEEGIELAIKAVSSAIRRDTGSGEGIDVAVVDDKGFRLLEEKTVTNLLKK